MRMPFRLGRAPAILRDRRGITVVEFAIVCPVMLLMIFGLCELAYQGYLQSVLTGAMQKAGRDSSIQGNDTKSSSLDTAVMNVVWAAAKNATYVSSRKSYAQFGNIAPEYFYDTNNNGVYDAATECFIDVNGNKTWDADPGISGQGGADDVTVYKMTVTYPRLFPLAKMLGWGTTNAISSTTILKNQPYASQTSYAATKICP